MTPRQNTLRIVTPDGIVFSLQLAGPIARLLAAGLDTGCIVAVSILLGQILGMLALVSPDVAQAVSILAFFVVTVGYGMVLEWGWRGQTIGKRLFRLRVVDSEGMRLRASQVVIRNLLRFLDLLPGFYFVGGVTAFCTPLGQRLGDIAANTIVVRYPRVSEPDLDQLLAGKFNSLREHPHLEARLRQLVTPAEANLALQAILRRGDFTPDARVALLREIAAHFRAKVEFPPEATEGLSDEQYVRNVVDVLYRLPARESRAPRR